MSYIRHSEERKFMKVGYQYAIETLLTEYKRLKAESGQNEALKSLREGIEYLCYPFREDLSEHVPSPLQDPDDPELNPEKADLSTNEKKDAFEERMSELSTRDLKVKTVALETLEYLKEN